MVVIRLNKPQITGLVVGRFSWQVRNLRMACTIVCHRLSSWAGGTVESRVSAICSQLDIV